MDTVEVENLIQKALKELDQALEAHIKKDFEARNMNIWNASSETEYLLFMLGIQAKVENEDDLPSTPNENKDFDVVECIVKAQENLQESLQLYRRQKKNLKEVYEKVFSARGYLIMLQEKIETKKL